MAAPGRHLFGIQEGQVPVALRSAPEQSSTCFLHSCPAWSVPQQFQMNTLIHGMLVLHCLCCYLGLQAGRQWVGLCKANNEEQERGNFMAIMMLSVEAQQSCTAMQADLDTKALAILHAMTAFEEAVRLLVNQLVS